MLIQASQTALVLIDYQQKLMPAIHGHEALLGQARKIATIASLLALPVIGTEQMPDKLGQNDADLRRLCDKTLAKRHFDACAEGLPAALPAGVREVVIGGCESHICLLQTALSLRQRGYTVWPLVDASGSRKATDHEAAFARLRDAGAVPVTVEMVVYEWLRESAHPQFREVLKLIR